MPRFEDKARKERLMWFGHVIRKEDGYVGKRMLGIDLLGIRKKGRQRRRFMDAVKEYMQVVGATENRKRPSLIEKNDPPLQPLTGAAERRKRSREVTFSVTP